MNSTEATVNVVLYVRGADLSPLSVTKELHVSPTRSHAKGDKSITSTNFEITAKIGLWALMATSDTNSIADLMENLSNKVGTIKSGFLDSVGAEEVYLGVFVAVDTDESGATYEFELSRDVISLINSMNVPVRFTFTAGPP